MITGTVGHRLADSCDEVHDGFCKEGDDETNTSVQHSFLCFPGHRFVTEAENKDDAEDDNGGGRKDAKNTCDSTDGFEDEHAQRQLGDTLDTSCRCHSLWQTSPLEDLCVEGGGEREECGACTEEGVHRYKVGEQNIVAEK